jgi:hypothetical protein
MVCSNSSKRVAICGFNASTSLGVLAVALLCAVAGGCGATKARVATEQLLVSDAIDRAVQHIDFSGLEGQKVYLDTKHIQHIKSAPGVGPNSSGIVDANYITSSVRQQLFAAGVLLQEKETDADYIVELRCGAIAADGHEVVYGIPANNLLASAAALAPNAPAVPQIPEISIAKRNDQYGAAKIGVFAYHRESKEPVWTAGIAQARSTAKDIWVFGAGPFQRGTIYDAPRFAGSKLRVPLVARRADQKNDDLVEFRGDAEFPLPNEKEPERTPEHVKVKHEAAPQPPAKVEPPTPEPNLLPTK